MKCLVYVRVGSTALVFGMLFCIRRHRPSRYHDDVIFPDDDVRENIIHYDEEGVGESLYQSYLIYGRLKFTGLIHYRCETVTEL